MINLLNNYVEIDEKQFYRLVGRNKLLTNCPDFILTLKKFYIKEKTKNHIYQVLEPFADESTTPAYAFSLLEDLEVREGMTALAIGINPRGTKEDFYTENSKASLEKTRQKILVNTYQTQGIKAIKLFIQTDLFTVRTKNIEQINRASNLSSLSSESNYEFMQYWINKADIIIPAWGSSLNKFPSFFPRLAKDLVDNLNKVYILDKSGNAPAHPNKHGLLNQSLIKVDKMADKDDLDFIQLAKKSIN